MIDRKIYLTGSNFIDWFMIVLAEQLQFQMNVICLRLFGKIEFNIFSHHTQRQRQYKHTTSGMIFVKSVPFQIGVICVLTI